MTIVAENIRDSRSTQVGDPWQILIVDDDPDFHELVLSLLSHHRFAERPFVFTSAGSMAEGRSVLSQPNDFAVVLLDVSMETPRAGLELLQWIRGELRNDFIRVIMSTALFSEVPEHEVINAYDVNDYYDKRVADSHRLFAMVCAALRSWRELTGLQKSRAGLMNTIQATGALLRCHNLAALFEEVTVRLPTLVGSGDVDTTRSLILHFDDDGLREQVGGNCPAGSLRGSPVGEAGLPFLLHERIEECWREQCDVLKADWCCGYIPAELQQGYLVYLETGQPFHGNDFALLELYLGNLRNAVQGLAQRHS